jgi:aclacinomycin oxidase
MRMRNQDASRANRVSPDRIEPGDPRYADLVRRGFNKRFTGHPDYVRMVASSEHVVDAVQVAVRDGMRVAVRSGGHCLEGFVADPAVRVLIDTSAMTGVAYDAELDAFVIEAGTTLGEAYRKLYQGWGVLVPAGQSPDVGIGGHVLGGAFGFMHRQHGLAADHLYAVEVVVVDEGGTAWTVVATREPSDPNRELWWAHTGGGGGNFGIVTRYWFRSPDAARADPRALLPHAPESVLVFRASWSWKDLDETAFTRLARNFGAWCEQNSAAGSPACELFSLLLLRAQQAGTIELKGLATGAGAERLVHEHLAALDDGVGVPHTRAVERLSWLSFALRPFPELFVPGVDNALVKVKDALLCKRFSDRQIGVAHRHLTRPDHDVPGGALGLATYGGKVNVVAPDATATPHRSAILDTACTAGWPDPRDETRTLAWVRAFYRDLFVETGGVPVPGPLTDGALINHPDVDLTDPAWNTSGVPWHTFYYQANYRRLQQVKSRYDPGNVFRHTLSIAPA